jgi:hypothetical protein
MLFSLVITTAGLLLAGVSLALIGQLGASGR